MAHKAGDNTQVHALGEALGWPFEIKRFVYAPFETLVNWPFSSTLLGIDRRRSSALRPPWPDLVLTAGRRNEPVARWIRRQSGGRTRLVHVGRPWARPSRWDLVITTPQYRLPRDPRILHNETPLQAIHPARLAAAAAQWAPRVAHLPRPYVTVLAGGNSGPYPFDPPSGVGLARRADAMARELGGSLLVTTSARTRPETVEALFSSITSPSWLYRWQRGDPDNPYLGFLALADRIIVTADSVSMMTEACATRKPVFLYDTGRGATSMRDTGHGAWHLDRVHLKAFIYWQTLRFGPRRLTRDIRIVQQRLVASGRAAWLGDKLPDEPPPPLRDLERAVARVRALFQ